jgi:hypothetical protein
LKTKSLFIAVIAVFSSSCGQRPAQNLDIPVDVSKLGAGVLWPYGVHGGGHPEGHPGFDFQSNQALEVHASADMTLDRIEPNSEEGGDIHRWMVAYRDTSLTINFSNLSLASGLHAGSRVKRGDVIGTMSFIPNQGYFMIHFGTLFSSKDVCPAEFFTDASLNAMGKDGSDPSTVMGKAVYQEKGKEPKLCNPK